MAISPRSSFCGQIDLLLGGEQGNPGDVAEVDAQRRVDAGLVADPLPRRRVEWLGLGLDVDLLKLMEIRAKCFGAEAIAVVGRARVAQSKVVDNHRSCF